MHWYSGRGGARQVCQSSSAQARTSCVGGHSRLRCSEEETRRHLEPWVAPRWKAPATPAPPPHLEPGIHIVVQRGVGVQRQHVVPQAHRPGGGAPQEELQAGGGEGRAPLGEVVRATAAIPAPLSPTRRTGGDRGVLQVVRQSRVVLRGILRACLNSKASSKSPPPELAGKSAPRESQAQPAGTVQWSSKLE